MNENGPASPAIPLHLGPGETGAEDDSPLLLADPVRYFTSGYRAHGTVFRTRYRGADCITIAGIEANDFFWQSPSDWSYGEAGPGFREQFGPSYVTQLDGAPHLRARRLLKAAFSAEAVGRWVPQMARVAQDFLARRSEWSDDAGEWIPALLLALNGATLLKTSLEKQRVLDAIRLEGELIYGVGVSAAPTEYFARPNYRALKARVFGWVGDILDERLAGRREADNLQALIDQDSGDLGPPTAEELRNDAYMLLVAGIHNTARLTERILERLSLDPAWVDELRKELEGYGPDSLSRGMGAFPKLRSTVLEGERLHPGGTFLRRRPVRDLPFSGHTLPAGSRVLQAHTLAHFLPEYYPDPLRFNPRRWLEGTPPPRKALADFGGGSHICIGMNLSRIQVPIVLAELLRRYDWSLGRTPSFHLTVDIGRGLMDSGNPIRLSARS